MKRWKVEVEPCELNGGLVWVARVRGPRCDLEYIDECGADALAGALQVIRAARTADRERRTMLN